VIGRGYWYGPSGGGAGSTHTLQEVSDAGSSTTTAITVQGMQISTSTITNTTAAFLNLLGNNAGGVTFSFASTHKATIGQGLLTADRGYDLPDASGTFALTNQTMPTGGTTGQVLAKIDGTNYNTQWVTPSGGGGGLSGLTTNNVPYATSSTAIGPTGSTGANGIYWDNTNNRLLINKTSGSFNVDVTGSIRGTGAMQTDASMTVGGTFFQQGVFSMGTGSAPDFVFTGTWNNVGNLVFRTGAAATPTIALTLSGTAGSVIFNQLTGTGTRIPTLDASGVFGRSSIDPANIQQVTTVATALTAAGTNQSTALALSGNNSVQEVTTTASGTGVKLPTASSTSRVAVINRGANDLVVYPVTSGVINGQSANAGFTIPAGASAVFVGKDATSWYMEQAMRGGDVSNSDASKALTINANAVTTTKINDAAVTYAKIQNVTAIRLLGRYTNSNGVAQEITIGSGLSLDNTTGVLTATGGGGGMSNPMTAIGQMIYGGSSGAATAMSENTSATKKFLSETGTGSAGQAPSWLTLSNADVGLGNVENTALSTWPGSSNITTVGTITSGTWSAGTIAINKGGTGQTTAAAAFDALSPNTTLGDFAYRGASSNVRLPGNTTTTKKFLTQTGDGTNSAAPGWNTLAAGDIPSGSGNYIQNQSTSAQSSSSIYTSGAIKTDNSFTSTATTAINFTTVGWAGYGGSSVYLVVNGSTLGSGLKMWVNNGGDLGFFLDKDKSLTLPGVGLAADGNKIIIADAAGKLGRTTLDPTAVVTTSSSHSVSNSMLAQMAAHTFKGNNTASTADASDLTATQLTAELNAFVASGASHAKGLVPDPGSTAGTTKYLREDGTWVAPPGSITAASNVGSGVGVWFDINGGNTFRFKSLTTPTDGGITITDNGNTGIDLKNNGYDVYGKNRVTTSSTSIFDGKYFNPLPADCAGTITVELSGIKSTGESFFTIRQINFKKVSGTCTLGTETILKANETLGSFGTPTLAWSISANHPDFTITPPSSATIYWNTTYKVSYAINNL
jgi:hypothetical protein